MFCCGCLTDGSDFSGDRTLRWSLSATGCTLQWVKLKYSALLHCPFKKMLPTKHSLAPWPLFLWCLLKLYVYMLISLWKFPSSCTWTSASCSSASLTVPSPVCWQVVEIALKVSPILGAHMFQPLLPAVFKGIVDGEVSFAMRPHTLSAAFVQVMAGNTSILQGFYLLQSMPYVIGSVCNCIFPCRVCVCVCVCRDIQWLCPPTWGSWAGFCSRTPVSSPLFSLKWHLSATRRYGAWRWIFQPVFCKCLQ